MGEKVFTLNVVLYLVIYTDLVVMIDYPSGAVVPKDSASVGFGGKAPLKLLNDGTMVPIIAVGAGRGTAVNVDKNQVRFAVHWAISAGYRHIDTTAAFSFADEKQVGLGIEDAIRKKLVQRENLFVSAMLRNDRHRRDQVVETLRETLGRLGLSYVDLYMIHWPISFVDSGEEPIDYIETWQGMEEAKNLGLTRSIGVANFNATQLDRLMNYSRIKPVVNQIEVNPTMTQETLVRHCHMNNVVVMAYCPFGFLVNGNMGNAPPPFPDDPKLVDIAVKYGKNVKQVVLRYLIDRDLVVIPKTANRDSIFKNIDIFDFRLTELEIHTINQYNRNIRVNEPLSWQNLPNYPFERRGV